MAKFFRIRNLLVSEVEEYPEPWNYDVSDVNFDIDKKLYRERYLYNRSADHALFSMVEGVTSSLRVSATKRSETQNPPFQIHGFFADYDEPADAERFLEAIKRTPPGEFPPVWYIVTQSHKLHAAWYFEVPIRVTDLEHANKFLAEVAIQIKASDWGSGKYDKKVSETASSYLDVGRKWLKFSNKAIPADLLHLWDYRVFSEIRKGYSSVMTDIPFEVIQQEIRERFPGRVDGTVGEGQHCCRFWDPESDNDRGCMFVKDGVRVFVPHDKPFMSWRDIFGSAFVDKYASSKMSPVVQKVWYNSAKKDYWRWLEPMQHYAARSESVLRRDLSIEAGLRLKCRKGEETSEVDNALHDITSRRDVAWVAPILFHPHGPMQMATDAGMATVLNISLVRVLPPSEEKWTDDWRWDNPEVARKFPFIHGLVSTLLELDAPAAAARLRRGLDGDEEYLRLLNDRDNVQLKIFLSWLAYFYQSSAALTPTQGQCMVMAGASGIGKTFLMRNVLGPLMGGYKDADKYFIDNEKFTGDIVSSPIIGIDDKVADLERNERAGFTTRLKSIVATGTLRYEAKYMNAVPSLPWLGRVMIVCNLDSRSLSVLPDLEQSNADKITMLKLGSYHYPFMSREANLAAVARELPYFARFLLQYRIAEEVRDVRMGAKAYQHPEMVQAANDNGYVRVVVDALNMVLESMATKKTADGKIVSNSDEPLHGNARTLFDIIGTVSGSAAREIGGARRLSQLLEQLARGGYHIKKIPKRSTFEWIIPRDFDKDDIKNKEEENSNDGYDGTVKL